MELSVRDWLIIVGVLLVLAVLLDGYRRMRQERRNQIRMSLSRSAAGSDDPSLVPTNPELPNGGARVVTKQGSASGSERVEPSWSEHGWDEVEHREPPVLMEADNVAPAEDESPVPEASEPDGTRVEEALVEPAAVVSEPETPHLGNAEEVLIVNVVAKDDAFAGPELLQILLTCDLRFGKMNIFHRYEEAGGKGPVQFSVANLVEPGVFDLDNIDDFSTGGVCFFIALPGPKQPLQAFDYMVETAQCLVRNLNGELRDEAHSAMTTQTLEHCRARIREFERRQLTHSL